MNILGRRTPALLVLALLALAGCGVAPPAAAWPDGMPPRNTAISVEPIELEVWLADDYFDEPPIVDLVADFERAYPNIKVKRTGVEWEQMLERVEIAVSQGNPPDMAHAHAYAAAAQGLAEEVNDLWQAWGAESEFMPGALEDVIWQGNVYGVPLDINTLFTIFNRRLFTENNIDPPDSDWTFDELRTMTRRLTVKDGSRYGTALSASGWYLYGLVRAAGGDLLTERDGKVRATLDDPRVLQTLLMIREMGVRDQVGTLPPPQPRQSDHPVALFGTGKVALFFSGPWDLARLKEEAPQIMADVGTAPLPRGFASSGTDEGTVGGSVQGGGSLFVPRGAQHREAAFELMKWAVSDKYARRLALEMGRYPVKRAQYQDPALQTDPLLQPFFAQLRQARPYQLDAYLGADNAWKAVVRSVFQPDADIPSLLAEAQQQAQQAIDEVEASTAER